MGKLSRNKGKVGEREFAAFCREHGYADVHRTAQFKGKTGAAGDCEGLPGIHIEVKRTETLRLYDALDQSKRDAAASGNGELPIVAHRKNECKWIVIMDADDWFALYREWESGRTKDE